MKQPMYVNGEDGINDVEDTEGDLETPTVENQFSSMQVIIFPGTIAPTPAVFILTHCNSLNWTWYDNYYSPSYYSAPGVSYQGGPAYYHCRYS